MSSQKANALRATVVTIAVVVVFLGYLLSLGGSNPPGPDSTASSGLSPSTTSATADDAADSDSYLESLFADGLSDVPVTGSGTVIRVLSDDNTGDRHQRFILELDSGLTLLIAHNIDIAPRLDGLRPGDVIDFAGEYVYSDEGGTIHWTHHDPDGSHQAGWLEWEGQRYS